MALTIRMRIDENDEHSYYYATGSGSEIELIPLVVDENGEFIPDEGKAYNKVTVNVPQIDLDELIVDANGTYIAEDGTGYNVVRVNVSQIINLQNKSVSYSSNGTYSVSADSGYDGLGTVGVTVSVPSQEPNLQDITEQYYENGVYSIEADQGYDGLGEVTVEVDVPEKKLETLSETIVTNGQHNFLPSSGYDGFDAVGIYVDVPTGGSGGDAVHGTINVVDANEHSVSITVPSGKSVAGFAVVSRIKTGTTDSAFTYIMNGGGRNQTLGFCGVKEVGTNYWFKFLGYKGSTGSTTSITANMYHQVMNSSATTTNLNSTVVFDEGTDALKYVGREYDATNAYNYGLAIGCTYDYYVWFI